MTGNKRKQDHPGVVNESHPRRMLVLVCLLSWTAGTGTVAMARCWRDIVHMEVTQTLKKFDSTDSPHMVASDVLNIYNQLKQAMLELFGGHSQFALALKEGFSKAFQSLDEVTGVRVSGACVHVCAVGVNLLHRNLVPLLLPLVL